MFDELDFYDELGVDAPFEGGSTEEDNSKDWIKNSKLFLISDLEHLRDMFSRIPDNADVAHDTETTSLDIETAKLVGISMAYEDPLDGLQGFYIPTGHSIDSHLNLPLEEVLDEVTKLGSRVKYVFYNLKYDAGVYKYHGVTFPNKEDAMVSVFCYDSGHKGIGLKGSSKRFFNESMIEIEELFEKKEQQKLDAEYAANLESYQANLLRFEKDSILYEQLKGTKDKIKKPRKKDYFCEKEPVREIAKISKNNIDFSALSATESYIYAASDALQTLKLYKHLAPVRVTEKEAQDNYPLVKAAGQSFIHKVENKLIDALLDMECNKFRIDMDYIKNLTPVVIQDIYSTMADVYRDLKLPNDFGNRSDFFYKLTQIPVRVKIELDDFSTDVKQIKYLTGKMNGNPCKIEVKNDLSSGTYKVLYSDGFIHNAKATLSDVPDIDVNTLNFDADLIYPEKTEFFLDSPVKVGHLLFTPKDKQIDFYTGVPIESYEAEVTVGFAENKRTQTLRITGLKEKLGDKYNEEDVYRINGFGVKGGKVTEKAGQWQTDDNTLTPLAGQSKAIDAVLRYRKKKKNLSTYLLPFYNLKPHEDGNYYAKFAFRSMAAPSGRFAAGDKEGAGYIGMNAQAIPSNDAAFWVDTKRVFSR